MANHQSRKTQSAEGGGPRSTGPWLGRSFVQPAVIGLFHRHRVLNGARLGEILGVGRSSAHLILERLLRDGCILMEERRADGALPPGRPPTDYRLNPAYSLQVGIHLSDLAAEWVVTDFTGRIVVEGRVPIESANATPETVAGAVDDMIGHAVGADWQRRSGHLGIAVSESGVGSGLWDGCAEPVADKFGALLNCAAVRALPAATAAATAESIRVPSRSEPTLYVEVRDDFICPAGFAGSGYAVTSSRRRPSAIDSVAKRRSLWLAKVPSHLSSLSWRELINAAGTDEKAAEFHSVLAGELAEEVAKFAAFLSATRVVIGGRHKALVEGLFPEVSSGVLSRLEVPEGGAPCIETSSRGPNAVAIGASLMPVAATIARSHEFESDASVPSGPTSSRRRHTTFRA